MRESTTPTTSSFARTIETWQAPIIAALQTGLTNARTEGYNRIVKHIGRIAFGFRNPDNQRHRVRCHRPAETSTPDLDGVRFPCIDYP